MSTGKTHIQQSAFVFVFTLKQLPGESVLWLYIYAQQTEMSTVAE